MDPFLILRQNGGRNMLDLGLPYAQEGNDLGALANPKVEMIRPVNDLPPGAPQIEARDQSPEAEQGKMVTAVTESAGSPVTGNEAPAALAGKIGEPPAPQGSASVSPKVGTFNTALSRVLQFEGGLNKADTNGTPSNFGINQAAHPEVDVTKLTPAQAAGIYKKDYWDSIGADKLPAPLAHVAFDSAVLAGPGKAKEWIKASGGDPAKFMDLREGFLNGLLQADPAKYGKYAGAWGKREGVLRADIGLGGTAQPFQTFGTGGELGSELASRGAEGNQGIPSSDSAGTAGAAAGAKVGAGGGATSLKDLMTLSMIQQMFGQHVFTPVAYDPFKVMPKLEVGQNG